MSSQLKEEREMDMLLRNNMTVKASPEGHATELKVIRAYNNMFQKK